MAFWNKHDDSRAYLAEFLGAFLLVFCGTTAIAATDMGAISSDGILIPFAFAGALMVGVFALGHISGAHFNPAITLALASIGKFPSAKIAPYIIAQILGAVVASFLLLKLLGGSPGFNLGLTLPAAEYSWLIVAAAEMAGAFILALAVTAIATDSRTSNIPNGLAIGGALLVAAVAFGWAGGGSFNPARSLGPALVSGELQQLWIYLISPVVGAMLASNVYNYLRED